MQNYQYILTLAAVFGTLTAQSQTAESLVQDAEQAYLDYNFSDANSLLATANKKMKKNETDLKPRIDDLKSQIQKAEGFMERVEQIEIIDSISVPKVEFFKNYRLPASAGHLRDGSRMSAKDEETNYIFSNEKDNYRLWASPDSTGYMVLREQSLLTDGNWNEPLTLTNLSVEGADVCWPFMMADGVTLYYAQDGEDSMGGLDIMVATRDGVDGDFLQPQNLGMPYNSPYNDYMLAIDELNGVGWFATDRNQIPDMVTIYVYKLNDMRRNYDPDTEELADRAMLRNWQLTQPEDADYTQIVETINSIDPDADLREFDFSLPMDGGKIYHFYDDFKSRSAAQLMKKYMADLKAFRKEEANLGYMRQQYAKSQSQPMAVKIKGMEIEVEMHRKLLKQQLSDIYRTERKQ